MGENLMDKAAPKQQPKVSTDPAIKTDKKKDNELAENELNQVTGGTGWNIDPNLSDRLPKGSA
jgi:bacteriocin-like protein